MKDFNKYFLYLALFTAIIVDIIIFDYLMVTLNAWEKEITAAMIAFLGSILGGFLTLIGVRWTLDEHRRKEKEEEYKKAEYIFIELLSPMTEVINAFDALDFRNWSNKLIGLKKRAEKLESVASDFLKDAWTIDIEFYREIKNIEFYAKAIKTKQINVMVIDDNSFEKAKNALSGDCKGIAKADMNLQKMVSKKKNF